MSTIKHTSSRGFSLIETLVAVAILMISITGPLTITFKALTASLNANANSTATFLAQEEMEIIKNIRDNNLATNGNWMDGLFECKNDECGALAYDIVPSNYNGNIYNSGFIYLIKCNSYQDCKLINRGTGYVYTKDRPSSTIFSPFTRKFQLNPISSEIGCSGNLKLCSEVQAVVTVSWKDGSVTNSVELRSELTKALR